jgi:predicted ribosome quality control (RQC) complex YloA/Tae2 family protein
MQTNYYFLKHLSKRLATELTGLVLAECFSQEKDELVLGFCTEGRQWKKHRQFYIKAILHTDFACLTFPDEFRRAGKNSVDLFKEVINLPVIGVRQFLNERAFAIQFEQNYTLLFKMYGNRSNIILFLENEVIDLLHNKLVSDNNLDLTTLDRAIDQSQEAFLANGCAKTFPTIKASQIPAGASWETVQAMLAEFENPIYYLKIVDFSPVFSLSKAGGEIQKAFDDPLKASNEFYYAHTKINIIDKEKAQIIKGLQKRKAKNLNYIEACYKKLEAIEGDARNEEIANIIMANLHQIPERTEVITLDDFYRDRPIKIRLKPDLSPQKNAEGYYRKSKNEKIEIQKLTENIEAKEEDTVEVNRHLTELEPLITVKELRKYLKVNQLVESEKAQLTVRDLFKCFNCQGWEILVGKNAKNNDLLTQRYARKEDLWLHARDVSGSHVVIRRQAGKKFPNSVIERAAGLAAYYSKRKNDTLCPVIVTPRKFVRKTKDLAEGQVIVDKEDVIMIEPSLGN